MKKSDQKQDDWISSFYAGLQELVDSSFPKICNKCGKVYRTKQEFLNETTPVRNLSLEEGSGLFALEGTEDTVVGVFRNCQCGTTLMADFQDRRDTSEDGIARRRKFEELLNVLTEHGLDFEEARDELLNILHGQRSEVIEKALGDIKL